MMTTDQIAAAKTLARTIQEWGWPNNGGPSPAELARAVLDLAAEVDRLRGDCVCTVCRRDVAECECPAANELES